MYVADTYNKSYRASGLAVYEAWQVELANWIPWSCDPGYNGSLSGPTIATSQFLATSIAGYNGVTMVTPL